MLRVPASRASARTAPRAARPSPARREVARPLGPPSPPARAFGFELARLHPSPSLPLFNEPLDNLEDLRIFGALAACSISGPNLAMEAYFPDTIDQQINQAVSSWMSNPWKGLYISKSSYTVYFTEIMKWFKDDFDQQGGVVKAYYDHFPQDAKDFFDTTEEYQIRYIDYIWDANGPVSCSCMPSVTFSSIYGAKCHVV